MLFYDHMKYRMNITFLLYRSVHTVCWIELKLNDCFLNQIRNKRPVRIELRLEFLDHIHWKDNLTEASLLRSPKGLGKSAFNSKVTKTYYKHLSPILFSVGNYLGDRTSDLTVNRGSTVHNV